MKKSAYIRLDDRFTIGVDTYNWILRDKEKGTNNGLSFFSNPNSMTKSIVDRLRKDAVLRCEVDLDAYRPFKVYSSDSVKALWREIDVMLERKLRKLKMELEVQGSQE